MRSAVKSLRVVVGEVVRPATIVIEHGKIAAILGHDEPVSTDTEALDVGNAVVMAGLVDPHVHINEPGRTQWEGFVTATRAAAAGGVTTLVDMPLNCIPVTTTADALRTKLDACRGELWVDVGFWGGVVPDNAGELAGLADAGVLGCKAFMIDSGIEEFPWSDEAALRRAMPVLREAGLPLLAHAELDLGAEVTETDPRKYRSWLQSRPSRWEDAAIELLIELCRETGCAVHVVHLSSADSLPRIADAKAKGLPITVETCVHYLCLSAEDVPDGATAYKCAPPIREADNQERLWQGLLDGTIDFVVTDHSPCTPALKRPELGDFHQAWGGVASLQLGLSSVWTHARARGVPLPQLSRWLCSAPARFAGLAADKGRIEVGLDADLVIWDPEATFEVVPQMLQFKHKVSPYLGRSVHGAVQQTWLRGAVVYDHGQLASEPRGRPLLRARPPA